MLDHGARILGEKLGAPPAILKNASDPERDVTLFPGFATKGQPMAAQQLQKCCPLRTLCTYMGEC